jgi:hypothetical protein
MTAPDIILSLVLCVAYGYIASCFLRRRAALIVRAFGVYTCARILGILILLVLGAPARNAHLVVLLAVTGETVATLWIAWLLWRRHL